MTLPWRPSIKLVAYKVDEDWERDPTNEEGYAFRPPVSFVAFVASAVGSSRHPFSSSSDNADL